MEGVCAEGGIARHVAGVGPTIGEGGQQPVGKRRRGLTASTTDKVYEAAMHLASARFISHGTWKWTELQIKTGSKPVYRYLYARPRPPYLGMPSQAPPASPTAAGLPAGPQGAGHSAEIQYAMGNLDLDTRYSWVPADYAVSKLMQAYFVNSIKTAEPNGPGLPNWPAYSADAHYQLMRIDVESRAEVEPHRDRFLAIDAAIAKP